MHLLARRKPAAGNIQRDDKKVHVLAIADKEQMRRLLACVWDPKEFRSDYGLRSLSKDHKAPPFIFDQSRQVGYEPGESLEMIMCGNSNWRGPVWFPTTFMMIESLRKLSKAYGPLLEIKSPGEPPVTLDKMAEDFAESLIALFTRNETGQRPVYGDIRKLQVDPHWCDYLLFYEYFHGDSGKGLGASHQTGWTGLVASLIDEWRK